MRVIITGLIAIMLSACVTTTGGSSGTSGNRGKYVTYEELEEIDRINYQLGASYIENANYDVAEDKLMKVVTNAPNFPEVYNALGVLSERRGRFTNALTLFFKAIELNPNLDIAMQNYTRLQCRENGTDSLEMIAYQAQHPVLRAGIYTGVAECALGKKSYDVALKNANQAINADPNYGLAYFNRAVALYHKRQYRDGLQSLAKFHDIKGYTAPGARLGLEMAKKVNDKAEIQKFTYVIETQFK